MRKILVWVMLLVAVGVGRCAGQVHTVPEDWGIAQAREVWLASTTETTVRRLTPFLLDNLIYVVDNGTTGTVPNLGDLAIANTILYNTTDTADLTLRDPFGNVAVEADRLVPVGTVTLGASGSRWSTLYGTTGDFSTQVNANVIRPYSSGGNLDLLDDDSDAGSGGLRINEGGTVTVPGRFSGDLLPGTDSAHDLGSTTLRWAEIWGDLLTIDNLSLDANTLASLNTNGDIILDPDGTGNIGFNQASPAVDFDFNGTSLQLEGANPALLLNSTSNANTWNIQVVDSGNYLRYLIGGSVRAVFAQGGNVGIGTDTTPDYLLDVQGTLNADGNVTLGDAVSDTLTIAGAIYGSRHSYHFYDASVTVTAVGTIAAQWVGEGVDEDYSIIMPHAGSVVGMSVMGNITETNADTEYVGVFIDGATTQADDTAIPEYVVEIDAGSTGIKSAYGTQARGTDTFTAGQKLTPCLGGQDMTAADNYTMTNVHVVLEVVFND